MPAEMRGGEWVQGKDVGAKDKQHEKKGWARERVLTWNWTLSLS